MALASNTHLGPYEILQPIGAGGMGQVYKARDTRLNRTVAIKVLTSLPRRMVKVTGTQLMLPRMQSALISEF